MEVWKDIKGYEGLYQVSNKGRVRSLPRSGEYCTRTEPIMMSISSGGGGYNGITLYKAGKRCRKLVHRLVAEAFIPNKENKSTVNHIDCNRTNNKAENLEWVTQSENIKYSFVVNSRKTDNKSVECVETGQTFESIKEAAAIMGVERSHISCCCVGRRKTVGGYHWRYIE